ncbi:OmpA family protein [Vibrio sp. RE86]|uniref:OmpA family protein n=1 Tax=Vibrio sp. RE86 TaxID=2607605 RepID=UPI0014936E25|nr:OmpA family protein [Vibrio sp. RE86]NOH81728.1 OmpA family protein [Vibrio sp. RE86]
MKRLALPLILLLSGCGTMPSEMAMLGSDMLDTAPRSDFDVRYPEWGSPTNISPSGVKGPLGQQRTESYQDLQSFLVSNGVDYELLPGNHVMVKLKDTIKFSTGSSNVSPDSKYWLDMMGEYLSTQPSIDVVIDGHADSTGAPTFNDGLSMQRASAVKQQLVRNNVAMNSIFTRGYGEYVPACSNNTTAGKACNRRVEVLFIVSNN